MTIWCWSGPDEGGSRDGANAGVQPLLVAGRLVPVNEAPTGRPVDGGNRVPVRLRGRVPVSGPNRTNHFLDGGPEAGPGGLVALPPHLVLAPALPRLC